MTEQELRDELDRLNREIPIDAANLDRKRERRDMLAALFPVPETPAPRAIQRSFAIGT